MKNLLCRALLALLRQNSHVYRISLSRQLRSKKPGSTIDTGAESHTGEYLAELTQNAIASAEDKYECVIVAITTDNAENMVKMKKLVAENLDSVITVGCVAHQLNLLAKDLSPKELVSRISAISKAFKYSHVLRGLLASKDGATMAVIPSDVRWSSTVTMFKWYQRNWNHLREVANDNQENFRTGKNKEVRKYIVDLALYKQVEDAVNVLTPISLAIDLVQGNQVTLADAVHAWKKVLESYRSLEGEGREWLAAAETRYNKSVTAVFFVAHSLHPKYLGNNLTTSEWNEATNWVRENRASCMSEYLQFIGGTKDVIQQVYAISANCELGNFYKSQEILGNLEKELVELAVTLISIAPSSAGLERVFSSMGFVHSDLRNRLAPEKVGKLAFCLRVLNEKF